ncbi:cytochrome P450 [Dentipellis sp. KUC8613]|nr:cytochrome P450 [Dentipellis sp. KUC8613]
MHPRHYRLRFISEITRSIVVPQVIVSSVLFLIPYKLSAAGYAILHLSAMPLSIFLRSLYESYVNKKNAERLGAVTIPCVRGNWPGNLDIVMNLVKQAHHDYPMQFVSDLFSEYNCKTLNLRILWSDLIFTIDEANVKYMLTGPGFEWFHKGYYQQERAESFLGNGIFNRDKEEWRVHRTIARPWFARDRISDLNLFDSYGTTALDVMSQHATKGGAFDMQDLLGRFALDAATDFLFGSCVNSLHGALPIAGLAKMGPKGSSIDDEFGTFAWAFEAVQVQLTRRTRIGNNWPLFEMFSDKTRKGNAIIQAWLRPLVDRALNEKAKGGKDGKKDEDHTFLDHLVTSLDDAESIRFQVLNMLLAGRDTTSTTLTFVVYFLCLHPDVMMRLRQEIINEYGDNGMPSLETMRGLKYLRAVLNETMRLFPPVPMNLRLSDSIPHVFPASADSPKYYVPPGTQILYSLLLIQRRKDLWGPDADTFRPERWLDPDCVRHLVSNPFMFIPFHAGPRICLGQNFAYNEMSFFLVRLLQKFERFELAHDAQPSASLPPSEWTGAKGRKGIEQVFPASSVTMFVKGGLWVRAYPAVSG